MLRIHTKMRAGVMTVTLEGRLLAPWVEEVRNVVAAHGPRSAVRLDLAGLIFVDHAGIELLNMLLRSGVPLSACSPFVAELLGAPRKPLQPCDKSPR